MMNYDEAKQLVIHALRKDAEFHEAGAYDRIGTDYDRFETFLAALEGEGYRQLGVAMTFWDSWIDARNHQWHYYPGMTKDDWPRLARSMATALAEEQEVTDPLIKKHFMAAPRGALWERILNIVFRHRRSESR